VEEKHIKPETETNTQSNNNNIIIIIIMIISKDVQEKIVYKMKGVESN
jgi:hypothetical protein